MAFVPFTETDQPTMAAFNAKFQSIITEAVSQGKQIEVGSYVGTGAYGEQNPNSLQFNGKAILVFLFVTGSSGAFFPVYSLTEAYKAGAYYSGNDYAIGLSNEYASASYAKYDQSSNTLFWYSPRGAAEQKNRSNYTVFYLALLDVSEKEVST